METKEKKSKPMCNCDGCKVKLSSLDLISNKCKCGHTYCAKHKYSSDHNCTFKYIEHSSTILGKTVVKVVASKLGDYV